MTLSRSDAVGKVDADRSAAIIAGVVFIIATAASLASVPLVPDLTAADYLTKFTGNANQVAGGGLLLLIAAFGSAGIAVAMYPVMRRWNVGLALASVMFRTMESVMYIVGVVSLLSMLTLSQQFADAEGANRAALQAIGDSLRGAREHAALAGVFCFCLGAFSYYYLFFQSRLIPRWLSGFGVVAILLMLAACLLALFSDSPVTGYVLLALPIAVQEIVLAGWLIFRGFDTSSSKPLNAASS